MPRYLVVYAKKMWKQRTLQPTGWKSDLSHIPILQQEARQKGEVSKFGTFSKSPLNNSRIPNFTAEAEQLLSF